jgi:MFS family permease
MEHQNTQDSKENISTLSPSTILKKSWSITLSDVTRTLTYTVAFVNVIIFSQLIWPGDPIHVQEMSIMYGMGIYVVALGGLVFGHLADKYPRVKLLSIITIGYGIGIVLNGFVPAGLYTETYVLFFALHMFRQFFDGGAMPLNVSLFNDYANDDERSRYIGLTSVFHQLVWILSMIISAWMFQNYYWREFFWIIGAIIVISGVIIWIKAKEPKRGATKKELSDVLTKKENVYNYQIDKTTRKTLYSPTNIIVFIEGFFTQIVIIIPAFLCWAYLEDSPNNWAPMVVSLAAIFFAVPGGIIGSIVFPGLSDKWGKKNLKARVYLIIIQSIILYIYCLGIFSVPITPMTIEQGTSFVFAFTRPWHWLFAVLLFVQSATGIIYSINQTPILQKINLPEAQGKISSANQFLEMIGHGTGPLIVSGLYGLLSNNYLLTAFAAVMLGLCGTMIWFLALKWINRDADVISEILKKRADEIAIQSLQTEERKN